MRSVTGYSLLYKKRNENMWEEQQIFILNDDVFVCWRQWI